MTTIQSRRAILAGAAALPALAAPAAFASVSPDPIFAALVRHREAEAAWITACTDEIADDPADALGHHQSDMLVALLATTPSSVAGCAALLRYLDVVVTEHEQGRLFEDHNGPNVPARDVLSRVASILDRAAVQS